MQEATSTAGPRASAERMPGSAADPAGASFDALGNLSSDLGRDENLVLFATAAHRSPGGDGWVVPVHGRIFRPPDGRTAKAALALALKTGFGVSPDDINRSRFDERCALMLGDNRAGRRIVITIAGANHLLSPSDRYGHFRGILPVPDAAVATVAAAGYIPIAVRLGARDHRHFEGRALMIAERGVSIISDIDDTVKVTHVASRRRMMAQTFLEAFEAVAGMAERYRGWVSEGAALHFISSSPWPLYEPLDAFLTSEGFPPSTKTLKNVALKDRSIRNLLAKATKTKPPAIDALLTAFPERRFILVGDSAENDAEIYADAARRHPGRVDRIFIRDCGSRRGGLERARRVLSGLEPNSWLIFDRAEDLPVSIS